jgi:hypothetical protein
MTIVFSLTYWTVLHSMTSLPPPIPRGEDEEEEKKEEWERRKERKGRKGARRRVESGEWRMDNWRGESEEKRATNFFSAAVRLAPQTPECHFSLQWKQNFVLQRRQSIFPFNFFTFSESQIMRLSQLGLGQNRELGLRRSTFSFLNLSCFSITEPFTTPSIWEELKSQQIKTKSQRDDEEGRRPLGSREGKEESYIPILLGFSFDKLCLGRSNRRLFPRFLCLHDLRYNLDSKNVHKVETVA